jgi:prophage antirepressor-like protein
MSTALVPFQFDGHELRHIMLEGIPWFVASDIAGILGLTNPRKAVADHADREDRDGVTIRDAIGRNQQQSKFLGLELGGRGQVEADISKCDIQQVGRSP